jgi:hypothetical protein
VSSGKIQITLRNVSGSKRPVEIPWAPKPKAETQIQLAPSEKEVDPKLIKRLSELRHGSISLPVVTIHLLKIWPLQPAAIQRSFGKGCDSHFSLPK